MALRYAIMFYLFLAVVVSLHITTYMLSNPRSVYTRAFSALGLCISVYLFGYLLELSSVTREQMVFWNMVQYFGIALIPAFWLRSSLLYIGSRRTFSAPANVAIFVIPVLTLIFRLTNDYHHWFYQSLELRQLAGYAVLQLTKGPWYFVQIGYMLISVTFTNLLFFQRYLRNRNSDRSRYLVLFAASTVPHLGTAMNLWNRLWTGFDYGALLLPVALSLVVLATVRFDFLEVRSLARENVFENSPDAMLLLDNGSRLVDYNHAALRLFPFLGASQQLEVAAAAIPEIGMELVEIAPRTVQLQVEEGSRWVEVSSSPMLNSHGTQVGLLKSIRDITEQRLLEGQLLEAATVDQLSGLYNRRHFMELAQQALAAAQAEGLGMAAVMIDIDDFKLVNDQYGHASGDAVIRATGSLMQSIFRSGDILGRYGGEEFAVVLPATNAEDVRLLVERLRETVASLTISCQPGDVQFTVSSGITASAPAADDLDQMLHLADQAMYAAKAEGKNRTVVVLPPDGSGD